MSLQRFAAGLSAAVLAGWAVTASAADAGDYGRTGPYVGASGIYAIENFSGLGKNGITNVDDSWGYNIKGGYRFNQIFALEARWEQWTKSDYDPTGHFDGWMAGVSGKAFFSDGPIQPYVLGGLGWMSVSDPFKDDTGLGVRFAGGLDFYATRNIVINLEAGYVIPTGGISDYGLAPIGLGIAYRFF